MTVKTSLFIQFGSQCQSVREWRGCELRWRGDVGEEGRGFSVVSQGTD